MKLNEALKLFAEFAWDETDQSYTDIVRYMGLPGQATSYTIGQLAIIQMRKEMEDALGDMFNEKEFHYIILSQVKDLSTILLIEIYPNETQSGE